jgi:ABC-2 type transport system ATP-binding protein
MDKKNTTSAPVIRISDLTVSYGRHTALNSVSLEVGKGEVYALLGRNGAGKTSLVRCLLGQWKGQVGQVEVFGDEAWSRRRHILCRVGVVPEEPDAPPEWTVAQISRFYARLYSMWDEMMTSKRLKRFQIPLDQPFGRLSKGQKGQVMLTMALSGRPDLLLLDDPTLGLDAVARGLLFDELIGELADRGTTVLITTHDLAGVEGIADQVGVLSGEKMILDESLESVKSRFRRVRGAAASDRAAAPAVLETLGMISETTRTMDREWVVDRFQEEAFAAYLGTTEGEKLTAEPMSLEDIFIALTGDAVEERQ